MKTTDLLQPTWLKTTAAIALTMTLAALLAGSVRADEPAAPAVRDIGSRLAFDVAAEPAIRELNPEFCWFHPRAAVIPDAGKDGNPAVIMTLLKHLAADDHYSGLYFMRTDDLGQTWTRPVAIPKLAWRSQSKDITAAVIDTTPGWHAQSGRLLVIGAKTLYTTSGDYSSLQTMPRSYETSYATWDPAADRWSGWKELEMPEVDGKFFRAGCGCSQWLVKPDGTLLVPVQFQPKQGGVYLATVLHCSFDGTEMKYLRHGTELSIAGGQGFAEPSLAHFQGKYFLTLRNDVRGYVATSSDGLEFDAPRAWTFDDGKDLGSYNTQTHWLTHVDGLFLSYTRRGANNDHIARHRAPLFVAQVNPQSLQVIRSTEQVLLPERGVMLGNFGASAITPNESWVTDAEFISRLIEPDAGKRPHPRGADGTVWVGRVKWSKPNSLVMDSSSGKSQPDAKAPADRGECTSTIVTVSKSTPELPRKSEGDVIELTDGGLLLVSMEFGGDGSDFAATRFVSHESSDGGRTWGRHRVITETQKGDLNVYSPNLIRAKDGGILLLFMRQHRPGSLTNHVWKSTDEGQTFSPLVEFVPKRDFALCNATVKRLASGRLILPANPPAPGKPAEAGPYAATVLYSDDDGLTWQVSESRVELPMRGAMEPHVEQTADGRLLMVMRNQLGKLHFSESTDNGASWCPAFASSLTAPESCPELTRIPGTSDLLMIWNNSYDPRFRSHFGKRSPLTAAVSKDRGKTWQHVRDIETDPTRAFSNPGCRFTRDGRAIINYWTCEYLPNWAMQDVIDIRVAVIDKSWFYGEPANADTKDRK
jgi:hypothetical protein